MADTFVTSTVMGTVPDGALFARQAEQTYAVACQDMISLFTSCTNKISGFTTLAFEEQASCYCCRTSDGSLSWTDELGDFASTCADWASTGEPDTAYSVAMTFATFCSQWSDACDGTVSDTATATDTDDSSSASATESTDSTNSQGIVKTVTGKNSEATESTSTSSSKSSGGLSTGAIAGIAAGAGVVALLILAGIFVWFWKKRKPAPAPAPTQPVQQTQQPFNGQQQQQQQMGGFQQPYYGQQQQPVMQQYNAAQQDNKMYQGPSPFQPAPAAAAAWPPPGQPPVQQAGQMHYAAELPSPDMGVNGQPVVAQELHGQDASRYSELPSETAPPQYSQPSQCRKRRWDSPHESFAKRAAEEDVTYDVNHEYKDSSLFYGLSITVHSNESLAVLEMLPEVVNISPVVFIPRPGAEMRPVSAEALQGLPRSSAVDEGLVKREQANSRKLNYNSPHKMTGVDRLHRTGIKARAPRLPSSTQASTTTILLWVAALAPTARSHLAMTLWAMTMTDGTAPSRTTIRWPHVRAEATARMLQAS
ncbi:hypothetical protein ACJZ2D_009260 [Fusarium nematophilum]